MMCVMRIRCVYSNYWLCILEWWFKIQVLLLFRCSEANRWGDVSVAIEKVVPY